MSTDLQSQNQPPTTGTPVVESPAVETSGHIDPAEYSALQAEVARYRELGARLEPQAPRIQKLLEDENAAQIFDDAVAAYAAMKERQGPQVPSEMQPVMQKLSRLEKLADDYENERKAAAERPQREFQNQWNSWVNNPANDRFYRRIVTENPDLKPRDLQYLAQVATEQNFAPLEDVWKQESWRFVKEAKSAPPSSLRADSGDIGIPAASNNGAPAKTARERILELERERLGRAS